MSAAAFALFLLLCSAVVVFPTHAERAGERVLRALSAADSRRRWNEV